MRNVLIILFLSLIFLTVPSAAEISRLILIHELITSDITSFS